MSTPTPTNTSTSSNITSNPSPSQQGEKKGFNPLSGRVDEKSYTNSGAQAFSQNDLLTDIPEPTMTPPPISGANALPKKDGAGAGNNSSGGNTSQQKAPKPPFNPALNELSESERASSAAQMAAFMMTMYEKAHEFGNAQLKIPEKKIQKMQMEGELDLTVAVPYKIGQFVQLDEYINEYNLQVADVLVVDEDFKKSVLPPLTRVLAKRGHGLTDEQYLGLVVSQDLISKGYKFFSMKSQTNRMLTFAVEQTAAARQRPVQPVMQSMQYAQQQQMPTQQQGEQIVQQPQQPVYHEAPVVPLQDRVIQRHHEQINHTDPAQPSNLPDFGNPGVLHTMDDIYNQELKQKEAENRRRQRLEKAQNAGANGVIKKSNKRVVPGAIPHGLKKKNKPGPKPGSKRKPKNLPS